MKRKNTLSKVPALTAPAILERHKQLDTEPDGAGPEAFLALVRARRRSGPTW